MHFFLQGGGRVGEVGGGRWLLSSLRASPLLLISTDILSRPRPAFLTPPPSPQPPQGIELLIAFFHVEVSHFLQLCQGSPELRHGWLWGWWREGEDNKSGGGAPQGTESFPECSECAIEHPLFICRSQAASKGQRHYFVGRGDLNRQHQQAVLISSP